MVLKISNFGQQEETSKRNNPNDKAENDENSRSNLHGAGQLQNSHSKQLPPYVSATPKLLADIDHYSVETVINNCGENVPWTDLFFHLIKAGNQEKLSLFISMFAMKAEEVGEELIDAYIDGNFQYLEQFRVEIGGIAGGGKFLKSNILFKFPNDGKGSMYSDGRNAMKVAAQELRVINHLVNEKSLNGLFVLPCLALITKCGLRMYASSLLPLNPKESLKYGCQDVNQSARTIKKEDPTMNNIFNLIGETLNLKSHSISRDSDETEILCADIEGHLGTDGNYYLVDTTRLFPPEAPLTNQANKLAYLWNYLRPELIQASPIALNSDCFSGFWRGTENRRQAEEGMIREVTQSIYKTLIPHVSRSIQSEIIQSNECDDVKAILHNDMLCLRHLPYVIQDLLINFQNFSPKSRHSFNTLLIEMFSNILKWKWYSLRGTRQEIETKTIELVKQYFSSNKSRTISWMQLLKEYCSIRDVTVKDLDSFCGKCTQLLEDLYQQVFKRFSELCGIEWPKSREYQTNICRFKITVKSVDIPTGRSLEDLMELKSYQIFKFGQNSMILASTLHEIARLKRFHSTQPKTSDCIPFYEKCLEIYESNGKNNEWQYFLIQMELIQVKSWTDKSLQTCYFIREEAERKLGTHHPQYGKILDLIGIVLCEKGYYAESLAYHKEALQIQSQILTRNDFSVNQNSVLYLNYAKILGNIAIGLQKMEKYEQSLIIYKESLKIYEQTVGKHHPLFATTLQNIGTLFEAQEKDDEAMRCYDTSLQIYEKSVGMQHPSFANTVINIAAILQKNGKYEEAMKYLQECVIILKESEGSLPNMATIYNNMATILQKLGKLDDAKQKYENCLRIRRLTITEKHPDFAFTLTELGTLFYRQRNFAEALKHFEQAVKIHEQFQNQSNSHYATAINNVGAVLQAQGKYEQSLEHFRRVVEICEKTSSGNSSICQIARKNIEEGLHKIKFHTNKSNNNNKSSSFNNLKSEEEIDKKQIEIQQNREILIQKDSIGKEYNEFDEDDPHSSDLEFSEEDQ